MWAHPRQCTVVFGLVLVGGAIALAAFWTSTETRPAEDRIRVTSPAPNTVIRSPLRVSGEARGEWYVEASFPVLLLDGSGREIAAVPAQAQGDWMTEEFVPFFAELRFAVPERTAGTLVLERDNPSGLPEHAAEFRIPVMIAP